MLKKNEQYTVTIDGASFDGAGVAHIEGEAVFIAGAILQEVCRIRIDHVGKTCAWASLLEVVTPSPHRQKPDCPENGSCGGCAFRHMDYEAECAIKQQRVLDCLRRIGAQTLEQLPFHGAEELDGYRNKVQFPVQEQNGKAVAGYYGGGTHRVCPISSCRIQPACADPIRKAVLGWMEKYHIRAYDEKTHSGYIRHIYIRQGAVSKQTLVCIVANCEKLPKSKQLTDALLAAESSIRTVVFSSNTAKGNVILGDTFLPLYGDGYIEDTLCGLTFRLSAPAFYQVNHRQAEKLYEKALEFSALDREKTAMDLYCGTGTISLCLAKNAKKVTGVEIVPEAIEDAKYNAQRNGLENTEFFCMDAGQAAKKFSSEGSRPDVIVVDPPRKGLSKDAVEAILEMAPQRLVYVSCDPATLARDVKLFCEKNYRLQKAEAFDLFPRCAHVETVVLMSRV